MLTIGISFLTSKNLPLVEDLFDGKDERPIKKEEYVVIAGDLGNQIHCGYRRNKEFENERVETESGEK